MPSPRLDHLRSRLNRAFLHQLLATPEGRQHVLSQVADAESSGESRIFEQALAKVDDPELAQMIGKHQADEIRHAALFLACEARTGLPAHAVPQELRLIERLDKSLGHPLARPIEDREGVMEAYLLLQVLEERAIIQFDLFIAAFREVDPATAAVFEQVKADEERHLKYCHAISRRYAPDEATRQTKLERLRRAEAEAHRDNQFANVRHTLKTGLIRGQPQRLFWRAIAAVGKFMNAVPVTPFYEQAPYSPLAAVA